MQRDRSTITYDQFVKPRRKWPLRAALAVTALGLAGGGAAAYHHYTKPLQDTTPPPALAQAGKPMAGEAYRWAPVAIGGGGFISGLAMDPAARTFVVRADVYGAYVWNAKQDRWSQLATTASMPQQDHFQQGVANGAYEVAVAPSRPDRIYMAINGYVYRSDDRGAHWLRTSPGGAEPLRWDANSEWRFYGPFLAVDPRNPDVVLLGTPHNGVWRTANAGASWQPVSGVPANLLPTPSAPISAGGTLVWFETGKGGKVTGRVFAAVPARGVYVSANGGASFAQLSTTGDQPTTISRGLFDRNGVFFGIDAKSQAIWAYSGGKWRNVSQQSGLKPLQYQAIAADNEGRIVALDGGGAGYISQDDGKSWSTATHSAKAGPGEPPWLGLADQPYFSTGDLMFDPVKPGRLWVAAGVGVFYADLATGDTHLAWVSQTRGIEELVANDIVQTKGHAPLFAVWDFGIHIKSDLSAYSTLFAPDRGFIAVQQVDWTPADPSYFVTNASDTRTTCCSEDGKAVMAGFSSDGGTRWTRFPTLPTPPGTKADDPWRMSFGTIAVSSGDPDNIVWAPAFNRTPFYTTDRGQSWRPVVLGGATGNTPGSFEHNWYQRKTLASDKARPGVFYLFHSGQSPNTELVGLWRTEDGGAHWFNVYPAEIAPDSAFAAKLRAVPGQAGHLFFTSGNAFATDARLRRSTDGGRSWQPVPNVTAVDDIAFGKAAEGARYPALYISGRVNDAYGVWRSVDAGTSWQRLVDFPLGTLDQVTVIGADPDVFGRVYLGYKGSGFIWGEPAPCAPSALTVFAVEQCTAVR